MRKRPLLMGACVYILGILYGNYHKGWCIAILCGFLLYASLRCIRKQKWKQMLLQLLIFIGIFGISTYRFQMEEIKRQEEYISLEERQIYLSGEIYKKEFQYGQFSYYLKNCHIHLKGDTIPCNQVITYQDADFYSIGDILYLYGKVNMFEKPRNDGQFDQFLYYTSQKIDFSILDSVILETKTTKMVLWEWLYEWRTKIGRVYEAYMDSIHAGVMKTMLLGDRSSMDTNEKQLYQAAGIAHMLSISGMHVSMIGLGIYHFLRKRRIRYIPAGMIVSLILVLYCIMTGSSVSTLRAVGMLFLIIVADVLGRSYDLLNSLGAVVILLLVSNPYWLWYSGFILSVATILGIGGFVKYWTIREEEKGKREKLIFKVENTLWGSIGIWLSTLPLIAWIYYEIPLYSYVVNSLLIPFLPMLFFCGLLGGIIGNGISQVLLMPCNLILQWYDFVATIATEISHATVIVGRPSLMRMLLYWGTAIFIASICKVLPSKRKIRIFGIGILLFILLFPGQKKAEWMMLDVGQGDGIFLQTNDSYALFIDGGSSNIRNVGTKRILPFLKYHGVKRIDYWFVSHADEDHVSGLIELLEEGYEVEHLVIADAARIADDNMQNVVQLAEACGTQIISMKEKDKLILEDTQITCLYPLNSLTGIQDSNDLSLVLFIEDNGRRGLFSGDISADAEKQILQKYGDDIADIDFYKVAHHGSKYSNSKEWLELLSPEIAAISCSKNNSYGHPHQETLERLEKYAPDTKVYRTDETGQINIWQ